MSGPIHFPSDLYRRDALELTARSFADRARIELSEVAGDVVVHMEGASRPWQELRDDFCTEALRRTALSLRGRGSVARDDGAPAAENSAAPWPLLAPYKEGVPVALGWVVDSLSPVRSGAATLALRHQQHGVARVSIRRNDGAPLGVAHTADLDLLLMNGGSGEARTEQSLGRALRVFVDTLGRQEGTDRARVAELLPHAEAQAPRYARPSAGARQGRRIAPTVDRPGRSALFEIGEATTSRLALYDALLVLAERCHVFLTRAAAGRLLVQIKSAAGASDDDFRFLVRDATTLLNDVARAAPSHDDPDSDAAADSPPPLSPLALEALLAELDAADAATVGIGYRPGGGAGHERLRVLNLRGTGACNSECVFCVEKFNPTHRAMPKTDAIRELILRSAGDYDMLFFASGEPTIHPKLFEHVELARGAGFTSFGMSSHFRTFADPRFARRTLEAGFRYFDISLHAADLDTQLEVNPIDDGGLSLHEALKGLAVLYRIAAALGIRISVTQKIVVSRLNVTRLEDVFRATYERGVRNFILQPVRTDNLAPELREKLEIAESEVLPHLNAFLRSVEHLDAIVKPYGYSRAGLYQGSHVETERNRVKNVYGRSRTAPAAASEAIAEERVAEGQHRVELRMPGRGSIRFGTGEDDVLLDAGLARGLRLPFGCRMGSCGMCCGKLVEGRVDQSRQIFLSDEQVRRGLVLLCQAQPRSDVIVEVCTTEEIDRL